MVSCKEPQDERDCFIIFIREPGRITIKEKVFLGSDYPLFTLHYFKGEIGTKSSLFSA